MQKYTNHKRLKQDNLPSFQCICWYVIMFGLGCVSAVPLFFVEVTADSEQSKNPSHQLDLLKTLESYSYYNQISTMTGIITAILIKILRWWAMALGHGASMTQWAELSPCPEPKPHYSLLPTVWLLSTEYWLPTSVHSLLFDHCPLTTVCLLITFRQQQSLSSVIHMILITISILVLIVNMILITIPIPPYSWYCLPDTRLTIPL